MGGTGSECGGLTVLARGFGIYPTVCAGSQKSTRYSYEGPISVAMGEDPCDAEEGQEAALGVPGRQEDLGGQGAAEGTARSVCSSDVWNGYRQD